MHRLTRATLFFLLGIAAVGACASTKSAVYRGEDLPQHIIISGSVVVEATGQPLPGVLIRVYTDERRLLKEVVADSLGRYRVDSLAWRNGFEVQALLFGFLKESRRVEPQCTAAVTDRAGRVLTRARCSDPHERLNFSMRPQRYHGR